MQRHAAWAGGVRGRGGRTSRAGTRGRRWMYTTALATQYVPNAATTSGGGACRTAATRPCARLCAASGALAIVVAVVRRRRNAGRGGAAPPHKRTRYCAGLAPLRAARSIDQSAAGVRPGSSILHNRCGCCRFAGFPPARRHDAARAEGEAAVAVEVPRAFACSATFVPRRSCCERVVRRGSQTGGPRKRLLPHHDRHDDEHDHHAT
eukprot:scaffold2578_cov370-Prasinococcus_capsulatus_cf.AAC.5